MATLTVPVLIKEKESLYKLLYLGFRQDGTILLHYPRKRGYKIRAKKDIPIPLRGTLQVEIDDLVEDSLSPYVSFHPGKGSIHVNLANKQGFQRDVTPLKMAEDPTQYCFPLASLVFPKDLGFLDHYEKDKYDCPLELTRKGDSPGVSLNVEFWVHPIGTYIDPNDLPHMQERLKTQKIVGITKLHHHQIRNYTVTAVVAELPEAPGSPNIVTVIYGEERTYVYDMAPL